MKRYAPLAIAIVCLLLVGVLAWWLSRPPAPEKAPGPGTARDGETPEAPSSTEPPAADVETAPEAGTEDPAEQLVVRVRDARLRPAREARVFLTRDGSLVGRGVTDEAGCCSLDAPGGTGEIVIAALGSTTHRRPSTLEAGEVAVDLPPGAAISGRVIVDGAPPKETVKLHIWTHEGFPGVADLPPAVRSAPGVSTVYFETETDGSFRVGGLPRGWSGFFAVERAEYVLVEPAGNGITFPVTAPRADLEVRISRKPALTGRVLLAGGRDAAPGAFVRLSYTTKNGGGSQRVEAESDGRFRMPVQFGEITDCAVTITDAGGLGEVKVEIDPARFTPGLDLGDVVLGAVRSLVLLVRNAAGKPVAGAVALDAANRSVASEKTDAAGRTTMRLSESTTEIRVGALGYAVVGVPVPARGTGDPLVVTLPTGQLLTVLILEPGGKPAPRARLLVKTDGALFAGPEEGPDPVLRAAGASSPIAGSWGGDEEDYAIYDPDDEGRVRVAGLRVGAGVVVQAIDVVSRGVLGATRFEPVAGESKNLVVRLKENSRTLRGRIVDADGRPLSSARVRLGRTFVMGDGKGTFRIEGIRTPRSRLEIGHRGHVPLVKPEFDVPVDGGEVTFTLEKGHTVRLEVVDASGKPVPTDDEIGIEGVDLGRLWFSGAEGPGIRILPDLPGGKHRIFADVAGRRFYLLHDAEIPRARLVVPALGAVSVRIRDPLEKSSTRHRLRLAPTGTEGAEVTADVNTVREPGEREIEIPVVLPGRYSVHLEVYLRREDGQHVYGPVREGPAIIVAAGKTTRVSLVE